MKTQAQSLSLILFTLLLGASFSATADDFRARIVKVQGEVYVVNQQGEQRKPEKTKNLVNRNETIVTKEGGKAVVQFDDGAMSVMDEKSSLKVEKSGWFSQLGGKIYYVFKKVFGSEEPRKVKTNYATIGIRGTTFMVYDDPESGQGVALQEGKLNIESPGKAFEIHKQKQADDFEAFKQQMKDKQEKLAKEFKDYKKKTMKEFVEYKKDFDLEANRVVSFDGNRVDETALSDDLKKQFDDFESFAGDYVKAYKELDDETGNGETMNKENGMGMDKQDTMEEHQGE